MDARVSLQVCWRLQGCQSPDLTEEPAALPTRGILSQCTDLHTRKGSIQASVTGLRQMVFQSSAAVMKPQVVFLRDLKIAMERCLRGLIQVKNAVAW